MDRVGDQNLWMFGGNKEVNLLKNKEAKLLKEPRMSQTE